MSQGSVFLVAGLVSALIMFILWMRQLSTRNAGTVDIACAFVTAIVAIWLVSNVNGDLSRKLLITVMAGVWGFRLGIHLLRRVMNEQEDGRYRAMREALGTKAHLVFFLFFQVQALWALMFALPMWAAAQSNRAGLTQLDILALVVWFVAMFGEYLADKQLSRFRENPDNKGNVCQEGLWQYSRHPNYFFEWLQWWAYALIAMGSPWWWITWVAVVVMLVFLLKVTGIPHTERNALRSRGEAYKRYQQTTSVFFPLPPKSV